MLLDCLWRSFVVIWRFCFGAIRAFLEHSEEPRTVHPEVEPRAEGPEVEEPRANRLEVEEPPPPEVRPARRGRFDREQVVALSNFFQRRSPYPTIPLSIKRPPSTLSWEVTGRLPKCSWSGSGEVWW